MRLEPYGARVSLRPQVRSLDPAWFAKALLEDVASSSLREGASLIGHLKCVLRTGAGHLRCNLTSVGSGAGCRPEGTGVIAPGVEADLDLAVMVYDLPVHVIDGLVADALERLLCPLGVSWSKTGSFSKSG